MVNTKLTLDSVIQFIPTLLLYAELHFRFKWTGSRYFQKEPEILADVPIRIEPNNDIPILLLIKDAHKYPIFLQEVNVNIYQSNLLIQSNNYSFQTQIDSNWWDTVRSIKTKDLIGSVNIDVQFKYKINGLNKNSPKLLVTVIIIPIDAKINVPIKVVIYFFLLILFLFLLMIDPTPHIPIVFKNGQTKNTHGSLDPIPHP